MGKNVYSIKYNNDKCPSQVMSMEVKLGCNNLNFVSNQIPDCEI